MWRGLAMALVVLVAAWIAFDGTNRPVVSQVAAIPRADIDHTETLAEPEPTDDPLRLIFPTSNIALLLDDGPVFFQYTDRYFEGRRSRPWEGGQYGFVRNPQRSGGELIYTRFHEGIDIRPVHRDRNGEPLDTVRTIDDGYVVYVNNYDRGSSYGKYVVIEHWWSDAPFYSLYAHLGRVDVRTGQRLVQGEQIGRMGYTGRGINKRRAHLHFEINMLLNSEFDRWYAAAYRGSRNAHGIYNGINLAGLDVASLYRQMSLNPDLTIDEFIRSEEPFFGVVVPNNALPDILLRYPWLLEDRGPASDDSPAWEIQFTASGLPLRVRRSFRQVKVPSVSMVREVAHPYDRLTLGRLQGRGDKASLSPRGVQYVSMIAQLD